MKRNHCSLCGTSDATAKLVGGKYAFVCFHCVGKALASAASSYGQPRGVGDVTHHLDADRRCSLCGDVAAHSRLVACSGHVAICGVCLLTAADACINGGDEPLAIVAL